MTKALEKFHILIADDDEDDQMMMASAFKDTGYKGSMKTVSNGEELMDYLLLQTSHAGSDVPNIILLDLNMPKKDGRLALKEIKKHPVLSRIPVIVISTSKNPEDVAYTYDTGANSFISKPSSYSELKVITDTIQKYWLNIAMIAPVNIPV